MARRGLIAAVAALALAAVAAAEPVPASTRQLLVVTSDGWKAAGGTLQRWERTDKGWRQVGEALPVVLGRRGLGWGAGEDPEAGRTPTEPRKREGDRRAPAGVFVIEEAFGENAAAGEGVRLRYRVADDLLCVDDPESPDYNRIVDEKQAAPHKSAERLRRTDDEYALAAVIVHNRAADKGRGSCIFLHVWAGPETPTIGCTALERSKLFEVVRWLDPKLGPRIVQLPAAIYRARRAGWRLP